MSYPETLPLIMALIGWCLVMCLLAWVADRKTKKRWPQGHGHASYWGGARRVNDE